MLKRSLFHLVGTSLMVAALAVPALCGSRSAGVKWVRGYEEGLAKAKSENRIAVVEFYTEDCSYCREMDKKTFQDASVRKLSQRFVMVKVNAMKDRRAMIRHAVRGFPTILVLDGDRKEITRITGYRRAEDLTTDLKEVLHKTNTAKETASR